MKPSTYSFQTHRYHLWAFIDAVIKPTEKILFVIHDWGSAYGFDWAKHNPDRVRGIAYMEGIVRPYKSWEEWSAIIPVFQGFRSPEGEKMILDENTFVEGILFSKLSEAEYAEYRRPFLKREDRWPTLKWPRSIPIAGEPTDVVAIVESYAAFMAQNSIPKFFVSANPGAILTGAPREFCRTWKNQTEITVEGRHFIQELGRDNWQGHRRLDQGKIALGGRHDPSEEGERPPAPYDLSTSPAAGSRRLQHSLQ